MVYSGMCKQQTGFPYIFNNITARGSANVNVHRQNNPNGRNKSQTNLNRMAATAPKKNTLKVDVERKIDRGIVSVSGEEGAERRGTHRIWRI